MSDSESDRNTLQLGPELQDMKLEEAPPPVGEGGERPPRVKVEEADRVPTPLAIPPKVNSRSTSRSPVKQLLSQTPSPGTSEQEEVLGGDITLKMEPGKAPKLSRTASHKVVSRPPPLYLDLPDVTEEAKSMFAVLPECTYANKSLGTTEHALECDCSEEWDSIARANHACGEDSDCINRATKMECIGDCGCGNKCQNQRFQRKQYADVAVIKTEKKGFGLRANRTLKSGDFIFEYIGEVIDERTFRRRMVQYDEEGIKHFYFMSLTKGEFVDATKKGNFGRFCNHSCNPNCFVDKWVVGDKLRMGIFAERKIKAGEELVFNYNVDRYGADPQPCYCGEPNCTGFIGGRTQTDNATKLSHATIEALGIDDGDSWDTAVAKKPRKKKTSEDDEEYVNDIQPKSLEETGVNKVMAALRQCTEKWVAVKLLSRIQRSDDERVGHRVIRVHGYEILKSTITAWVDDANVVLQALDILHKLPRITRNKIQDSKIEETIEKLKSFEDDRVQAEAAKLLEAWSKLEVAYRIPRMKRDPNASTPARETHFDRREKGRERSRSRSKSPSITAPKGPSAVPSGPRGFAPRNPAFFNGARPPHRPRPTFNPLPAGWFSATSDNGATYYYNTSGSTQWTRPTLPANQPPPPPPKAKTNEQKLQDIISSITQNATPTHPTSASATPQPSDEAKGERKSRSEKWKSLPKEKQEKLYEATLHPHVMSVVGHYRKKLDKEDLKRLSKEVAKKLVRGDYKHNKVRDPTAKLDSKHERTVKKFVKDFMDKAVQKKATKEKEKAAKAEVKSKQKADGKAVSGTETPETPKVKSEKVDSDDDMVGLSDEEDVQYLAASPDDLASDLKRKREEEGDIGSPKKSRTEMPLAPPPPPPPPPIEDMPDDVEDTSSTPIDDSFDSGIISSTAMNGEASLMIKSKVTEELVTNRVKQNEDVAIANGIASPMQLATPPTTNNGSCEHDSDTKDDRSEPGMNGERQTTMNLVNGS
ncbi:hypothetical protein K491DRAFT_14788 [Lophiostoma macrostomum CBS 122681]|uniref:Histone-lysine N-methyltransferase, H3 lysine-36 specific n=1 Tax=Lophiostoma macrostomum CBS 122681 TaxID=1314788 RepID=A0A6A6TL35_9PLEO|nr:hypothetical protein K491DRAFT_14788 [Lophiostoma macrostomum CBS 122681]